MYEGLKKLRKIKFGKKFRCFKAGKCFSFRRGLNIVVGDQGKGKSSLFNAVMMSKKNRVKLNINIVCDQGLCYRGFDFEKDSPRTKGYLENDSTKLNFQVESMFASHGESNLCILEAAKEIEDVDLFLIDEPDQALSIRSVERLYGILEELVRREKQVIISAHNPFLILREKEVLSVEHGKWMKSVDFLRNQLSEEVLESLENLLKSVE